MPGYAFIAFAHAAFGALALVAFWSAAWMKKGSPRHRAIGVWLLALAPLWVGLLQLIPLPGGLWAALPGHAPYAQALAVAQVSDAGYRALSLMPDATWTSVLAGIPLMAAFLLACFCSPAHLHRLVQALVVFAVIDVHDKHAIQLPHLIGGKADARCVIHCFDHICGLFFDGVGDIFNRFCNLFQDRIRHDNNGE